MVNQAIYRLYAPVYDTLFDRLYRRGRQRAVELLALQPGELLLIPGVGTGLDLPSIPDGVTALGIDVDQSMLRRARRHTRTGIEVLFMDAQALRLRDASVDAVLCNLVLTVVPDAGAAMREAWRVLRPGGRLAIFDKFLPDGRRLTPARRAIGTVVAVLGTDVNRSLEDLVAHAPGARVARNEPTLLGGQYRVVLLEKPATP